MPSKLHKLFAKRLRQFVEDAGGVSSIAKKSGISRQAIYQALGMEYSPTLETMERLADAIGRPVSDLLAPEGDGPRYEAEERARAFQIVRDTLRELAELYGLSWPPDLGELSELLFQIKKDSR